MKNKKIIIILSIVAVLLIVSFMLISNLLRKNEIQTDIAETVDTLPTGIIMPTEKVPLTELDITSISPKDGSKNVKLETTMSITFSRPFSEKEIDFSMSPDAIYSKNITENILEISFKKPLAEGTLYTYSINFPDDNQKVRLYRFQTQGELTDALPDTRSDELVAEVDEYEKENRTDIYITNRTPYENDFFSIRSDFDPNPPANYYFIITKKISDTELVQQSVRTWLELQGLTETQINSLDIRYP